MPDLTDVGPPGTVFDPAADDLAQTIASDLMQYNALTDSLAQQQASVAGASGGVGATLDSIDAISDAAGMVFDQLSADLDAVDLTSTIAESSALDDALSRALDSWAPDIGALAAGFVTDIIRLFAPAFATLATVDGVLQFEINEIHNEILFSLLGG